MPWASICRRALGTRRPAWTTPKRVSRVTIGAVPSSILVERCIFMLISYRRTSGIFPLLTLAAVGLVAMIVTAAVAATLLVLAGVLAVASLARQVVRGRSRPNRPRQPATSWPHETIDATVIPPPPSPARGLPAIDRNTL
jgi:hypothetical protein